jgi:hypothetical protein
VHVVTPEAFRALGIPLRDGRDFTPDDRPAGPPVVILSERAAALLGGRALGSRVVLGRESYEVVGVVGDVPYRDLASEVMPAAYFPLAQRPLTEGALVVRSARGAAEIKERLTQVMAVVAPTVGALSVTTLEARVDREHARFRGAAWLLGAATALALLLCGLGAYGIVSSHVTRSLPEIGIRMALGATGGRVAWSIGLALIRLALAGLIVGTALGTWSATYLRQYLFGVRPWDLPTVLVCVLVALFTALLAAWRPAGHASRLDPVTVLRSE